MKRLPISARFGLVVAGFLIVGLAGTALGAGEWDWAEYLPTDQTVEFGAETWSELNGQPESEHIRVWVTRGPLVAGTFDVTVEVRTGRSDLSAMRLLVADDDNNNGVIDSSEWVQVATGPITQQGSDLVGTTPVVQVSAFKDVYRVEHTWTDFGVSWDEVVREGIRADGPADGS